MRKTQIIVGVLLVAILLVLGACAPAEFEVISLVSEPSEVVAGETVSVTAVVKNTGGSEGTYVVMLTLDGVTIETKEVAITPGSSKTVTFSMVKDAPGTYEIGVAGLSLSLVVKPAPTLPEADFFLTLETELVGNKLTISGETNLPDGSRLGVSVYRLYRCEGETEWYVGDLAYDHTATVENGDYSDVVICSEKWYDDLSRIFRNTGNPPIVEVSDKLSVGVIFTPKRQQPGSVYEILGTNAENLKGDQVEPVKGFGETFYILEANAEVYFPFSPE